MACSTFACGAIAPRAPGCRARSLSEPRVAAVTLLRAYLGPYRRARARAPRARARGSGAGARQLAQKRTLQSVRTPARWHRPVARTALPRAHRPATGQAERRATSQAAGDLRRSDRA